MRMRKKKHSAERIGACAELLIQNPLSDCRDCAALFGRTAPKFLEIGCGKGDFASGLSVKFPEHDIIALERVPDVAMFALEKAEASKAERPDNLRFIIGKAEYLADWFPESSFDTVFVNFCDPWPKKGYHKRRLTAPAFLEMYARLLVPGGELHFKTDNGDLFDWSVEQFREAGLELLFYTRDLHASPLQAQNIVTEYERHFTEQGMKIFSAHVRFPSPKKEALFAGTGGFTGGFGRLPKNAPSDGAPDADNAAVADAAFAAAVDSGGGTSAGVDSEAAGEAAAAAAGTVAAGTVAAATGTDTKTAADAANDAAQAPSLHTDD